MRYVNKSELDNYEFGFLVKHVEYEGNNIALWLANVGEVIMNDVLVEEGEAGYWIYAETGETVLQEPLKTKSLVEASRAFNDIVKMIKM